MRRTSLNCVLELARKDERVVFIGSDLGAGTLDDFRQEFPERFFMEGISEANMIGMAAGMAMDGYIPYLNTIATFLTRRCLDQIAIDLCLHNLPVRLIASGGGLVYAPLGPTHQAIEDLALMKALPNMTVVAPCDADEMRRLMPQTLNVAGPLYIRLAKGGDATVSEPDKGFSIGTAICLKEPKQLLFVTTGIMTQRALEAAERLTSNGLEAGVLHVHTLKPFDTQTLTHLCQNVEAVVTLEEHTLAGGLGSLVSAVLMEAYPGRAPALLRLGIPDVFAENYGSQDLLLEHFGLQPGPIAERVQQWLKTLSKG